MVWPFTRAEPIEARPERQEIHCHGCNKYVQFDIDVSLNGNHVLNCPVCDHEHCRVVKDGIITDIRWDSRNGPTYQISTMTSNVANTSIWNVYQTGTQSNASSTFIANMWLNTTSAR